VVHGFFSMSFIHFHLFWPFVHFWVSIAICDELGERNNLVIVVLGGWGCKRPGTVYVMRLKALMSLEH